jgi:phage tail protein X
MPKSAEGHVSAILYEALHGLFHTHPLVPQVARFIFPDPLPVLIGIVPADQLAASFL